MNVKQIEYVLAVAKKKNFGKAADSCYITQSTLSTMVGKLESELGIRIFDRATKPVSITNEGAILIEQLKKISNEIETLEEISQTIKGELSGDISIAVIPTVAPYLLPEFLYDFTERFPKINFHISEMTTESITEQLLKRELDIGILAVPIDNEKLKEISLYNEPFVLYDCSSQIQSEYAELKDLELDNFWLLSEGHCLRTQVSRICDLDKNKGKRTGKNFDFKAGSIESLLRFVRINKGITILPYLASLELNRREIKKLKKFLDPVPARTIGIAVHDNFVKTKILVELEKEIKLKVAGLIDLELKTKVIKPL